MSFLLQNATLANTPMWSMAGWRGPARVLDVYDGDTFTAALEYPPGQLHAFRVRIAGIDAPELRTLDPAGMTSRDRLIGILTGISTTTINMTRQQVRAMLERTPSLVELMALGPDKYGRMLCNVLVLNKDVSAAMRECGAAKAYNGGGHQNA